ncbi:hypothetical protein JCM8097_006212 [Rhodosporidiobolus ruineniae]
MSSSTRLNTHEPNYPPTWAASPLRSFRDFNRLRISTELAVNVREDCARGLGHTVHEISRICRDQARLDRFEKSWHGGSVEQREEWCLAIFEEGKTRAERGYQAYFRDECPELTLSWASDSYNFNTLVLATSFNPNEQQYRHVPDEAWSRLNDWSSALSTPPSRHVRAFTEEGKLTRSYALARFCLSLFRLVLDEPDDFGPLLKPNVKIDPADYEHFDGEDLQKFLAIADSTAVEYCASCNRTEKGHGVSLTCCDKCKRVARTVWYCDAAAAVAAAGKSSKPPTTEQLGNITWLESYPRAVWGTSFFGWDEGVRQETDKHWVVFELPEFVRPFSRALNALVALRNRALKEHTDLDVGLLAYFVRLTTRVSARGTRLYGTADQWFRLLAPMLDVSTNELNRLEQLASERFEGPDGLAGLDDSVVSAFQQLRSGQADTSYPYQNLLVSATPLLDELLRHPTAFFAFTVPNDSAIASRRGETCIMFVRKDMPAFPAAVELLRRIAGKVVLCPDPHDVSLGWLILLVWGWLGLGGYVLEGDEEDKVQTAREVEAMEVRKQSIVTELAERLELEVAELDLLAYVAEYGYRGLDDAYEAEGADLKVLEEVRSVLRHYRTPPCPETESLGWTGFATRPPPKKKKNKKKKKKGGKKQENEKPEDAQADEGEEADE